MKVTVVSDARAIWGSEQSVLNLAPALTARGVRLTLACPPGDFARAGAALGLPHAPLVVPVRGGERAHPLRDLLRDARGLPAGARRIAYATRDADLVHSNNLMLHPDAVWAGRRSGRPTVLELHDIVSGPGVAALSTAAALADLTLPVSTASAAAVRGPGRRRMTILPQAVDLETFAPGPADPQVRGALGGSAGRVLVVMLGRVDPGKGVHRLVRAAAHVPAVDVAIVGQPSLDSGRYADEVRALGATLLGERFTYAGHRDDPVAVLRAADVLVNASDHEPFGLSLLEGMACEVACIGSSSGGISDFLRHGRNGVLVDPADEAALVGALRSLLDPGRRARLGAAGRATAVAEHSIEVRADRLVAHYRALLPARAGLAAVR